MKYINDITVRNLHLKRRRMHDASLANHHRYLSIDSGVFLEKYTEKRNCIDIKRYKNHVATEWE